MKGCQKVFGIVLKEYVGSSFNGTPTRNYIVLLDNNLICFVYTKIDTAQLFKSGEHVSFTARFGRIFKQEFITCRNVRNVKVNKEFTHNC